jgi:2-oxoglutarate dehydrogenase E2 component (dihydrolipoamide succinyltransferase)
MCVVRHRPDDDRVEQRGPGGTGLPVGGVTMEIRIPKLGMEMTEGTVARWLVEDGARVAQDQPLYLLETDKVENEVLAPVSGVLRCVAEEGGTYPVGEVIAELTD